MNHPQAVSARRGASRAGESSFEASSNQDGPGSVLIKLGRAPAMPVDPRLGDRDPEELLRRFLAPMDVDTFQKMAWARSAVAAHGSPNRFRALIRDFMHDLDLTALLQDTPTERIHAWMRRVQNEGAPSEGGGSSSEPPPLESITVDPEAALTLARNGAGLYFRAPVELEDLLVPGFCNGLRAGFAGRYAGDNKPRGEIETFIAGKGHVTGWHTDFQHNFTFQLRGTKTWRFKKGPVENNVRALTPHYRSRSNYEQQMKLHLISDPSNEEFKPPDDFFKDAEEIILSPGSVLYHPAGIWHHVECTSDNTVSINVSLTCATWADFISDGLRQLFWSSPVLRAPTVGIAANPSAAKQAAEAALAEMRRRVSALSVEDLLPPAFLDARPPRRVDIATSRFEGSLAVRPGDQFRFSRLAVLVPLRSKAGTVSGATSSSSSDSGGSDNEVAGSSTTTTPGSSNITRKRAVGAGARRLYSLHVNFGNEDVASWMRIRLSASAPFAAALEWLRKRDLDQRHEEECRASAGVAVLNCDGHFSTRELLSSQSGSRRSNAGTSATNWTRTVRLLRVLIHCGYLHKVRNSRMISAANSRRNVGRGTATRGGRGTSTRSSRNVRGGKLSKSSPA